MHRRMPLSVMLLTALLTGGCGMEDYNVVINNVGKRTISDACVAYGEFRSVGGVIASAARVTQLTPEYAIPATATVEWRTEDGQMHRKEVEVKKLVPKDFRGDIVFEIADDSTVTVRVVPREKLRF